MKNLILSKRMEAVVGLVPPHSLVVADIGCDHAYVSIKLIKDNLADNVIAMDVRKGPLEIAKHNVCEYGVDDKVLLRLSDGMEKLSEGEAQVIIIAGMGGILIRTILEKGLNILDCDNPPTLILQPQSDIREVRIFLYEHAYHIVREVMIFEEGKYYTAILAYPGYETPYECTEDWEYGKYNIIKKDEVLISFLENEASTYEEILEKLRSGSGSCIDKVSDRTLNRINEIENKQRINALAYRRCMG